MTATKTISNWLKATQKDLDTTDRLKGNWGPRDSAEHKLLSRCGVTADAGWTINENRLVGWGSKGRACLSWGEKLKLPRGYILVERDPAPQKREVGWTSWAHQELILLSDLLAAEEGEDQ